MLFRQLGYSRAQSTQNSQQLETTNSSPHPTAQQSRGGRRCPSHLAPAVELLRVTFLNTRMFVRCFCFVFYTFVISISHPVILVIQPFQSLLCEHNVGLVLFNRM